MSAWSLQSLRTHCSSYELHSYMKKYFDELLEGAADTEHLPTDSGTPYAVQGVNALDAQIQL